MRRCVLVLVFALSAASWSEASVSFRTWRQGGIHVKIPRGWHATMMPNQQGFVLKENPRDNTAAQLVMVTRMAGNASAQALSTMMLRSTKLRYKVTSRKVVQGGRGVLALATLYGKAGQVRCAVLTLVGNGSKAIIGMFLAKPRPFQRLGGARLLVTVISSVGKGGKTLGGTPTVTRGGPSANLTGTWRSAKMGGMMNRYQMGTGRIVGTDSRGSGVELQFSGKRYKLTYHSQMVYRGCASIAQAVEVGRYQLSGNKLMLRPRRWQSTTKLCTMRRAKTKVNNRPAARMYRLYTSGKRLVMRGLCAPFMTHSACRSTNAVIRGGAPDLSTDVHLSRIR